MTDAPLDIADLARRIEALPHDEREVIVEVLCGLEQGLEVYGALSIDHDARDFERELFAEVRDGLVYAAIRMIQRRRRGQ